jgi:N-acylneuraminate cytidylyltransferase
MIDGRSVLAIIPARGGSVRLPRKNLKLFHGLPIIAYSIRLARKSRFFDEVIVSTDDNEIQQVALRYGACVVRRDKDDGTKGTQEVAADVLRTMPAVDRACVIYPCAPLLTVEDLRIGLMRMAAYQADYAFSVGTQPLRDAGAFYWGEADAFTQRRPLYSTETVMVPIPEDRVCDINTAEDFAEAEQKYALMMARGMVE